MNVIDRILNGFTRDELAGGIAGEYLADGSRKAIGARPKPLRRPSAQAIRRQVIRTKKAALDLGEPPKAGEEITLILGGEYHGIDIVVALLNSTDATCEKLTISTLSTNASNAETIAKMMQSGKIGECLIVVAEMFRDKSPDEFARVRKAIEAAGSKIYAARNHSKIVLMQMSDGARYVLHGSLNLRRCHSFEQIAIVNDGELFHFFEEFILSMCPAAFNATLGTGAHAQMAGELYDELRAAAATA